MLFITLGKLCVKSTHGLIRTAPAGIGSPRSRNKTRRLNAKPPPAESPANTIFDAGMGLCRAELGGCVRYKSSNHQFIVCAEFVMTYKTLRHHATGMAKDTEVLSCKRLLSAMNANRGAASNL